MNHGDVNPPVAHKSSVGPLRSPAMQHDFPMRDQIRGLQKLPEAGLNG